MLKKYSWLFVVAALALVFWLGQQSGKQQLASSANTPQISADNTAQSGIENRPTATPPVDRTMDLPSFLPPEAETTLSLIASRGPFPHRQDGSIFQNREKRLPKKERGYYREYTVETPGLSHRGARRIVTGGDPPKEFYYTDDHYDSFKSFGDPDE